MKKLPGDGDSGAFCICGRLAPDPMSTLLPTPSISARDKLPERPVFRELRSNLDVPPEMPTHPGHAEEYNTYSHSLPRTSDSA